MTSKQLHDLSFVPANAMSDNLGYALASMGQSLGHQKQQEMVARLQGYQSLNHRPKDNYVADELTFFLSDVCNDSGVDMTTLDISYLMIQISKAQLEKIIRAESAVKTIDEWGSMALSACTLYAFEDLADDLWIDDATPEELAVALVSQERANESMVRVESVQLHVTPSLQSETWVSGMERHGYAFSTPSLRLETLIEAFKTGRLERGGEWKMLPVEMPRACTVSFSEEKGDQNYGSREMVVFDEDDAEERLRKEFPRCEVQLITPLN
jgi:hypothetical protein